MKLLDLFCGAGGAAMGYHRAGFEVVGVDIEPQPDYPFEFHQADAMTYPLDGFDAVHASPPCQGESSLRVLHADRSYERLLIPTLVRFSSLDVPWVVENVDNATAPVSIYKVRLCGSSFGLRVRRHRWFWSNIAFLVPPCQHSTQTDLVGVYGASDGRHEPGFKHPGRKRGPRQATTEECREVMDMPWATKRRGLTNAISAGVHRTARPAADGASRGACSVTARPSWLIALCVASAAALVTVLALIAFSPTPPPACSDSYDPSCATIYEEEG